MINEEKTEKIKFVLEEFFEKMTLKNLEIRVFLEEEYRVDVIVEDPQILIGQQGQTLMEIQKILRMILNKKLREKIFLNLDINGYKRKKVEYLMYLAKETADEVVATKKEKYLQPMSSYERRIIHSQIGKREDVFSESRGYESERCVVIIPK